MGYERNDRPYGDRTRADRDRDRYASRDSYGARDERGYGRQPQGYDYEDRGFFDRAGDEVRSWFGDEDAERRRNLDERFDERGGNRGSYGRNEQRADYSGGASRGWGGGGRFAGPNYSNRADVGGGYTPNDYGAGHGSGATSNWGLGASAQDREDWGRDPTYRSWRDRQMADLDRDYREYHQENQKRFHDEFSSWRQNRQTQRGSLAQVQEHQEVVGSDGQHIGTVDKVRGDRIILTKSDQDAGGHHHSIPSSWLTSVGTKVEIGKTADQAKQHWRDEERDAGSFWNRDGSDRTADRNRETTGRGGSGPS